MGLLLPLASMLGLCTKMTNNNNTAACGSSVLPELLSPQEMSKISVI